LSTNAEIVTLLVALLVAAATLARRRYLMALPHWRWLASAGLCLLVAWTATVVEHHVAYAVFDTLEHAAYLAQAVLLTVWIVRVGRRT
jgi:hypothetical protein